jgi:hypothetical protein
MKVTSDRIKARAKQLRSQGFQLSGPMVRRTLELNAGARLQMSSRDTARPKKTPLDREIGPESAEAA